MADMAPGLKGITVNTALYRPATYLERATHGLGVAGSMSLLLLVLVLGLFLWSWRAMLISVFSIVLSLAAATYVLFLLHATLTSMTLFGLALAVGAVIEDAVSTTTGLRIRALERRGDTGPLSRARSRRRAGPSADFGRRHADLPAGGAAAALPEPVGGPVHPDGLCRLRAGHGPLPDRLGHRHPRADRAAPRKPRPGRNSPVARGCRPARTTSRRLGRRPEDCRSRPPPCWPCWAPRCCLTLTSRPRSPGCTSAICWCS